MASLDFRRLGESIKALRKARGISQTELAKALGLRGPRAISELENGKRELKGSETYPLCKKLDCTLAELFGLEADPLQSTSGACLRGSDTKNKQLVSAIQRAQRQMKMMKEIEEVLGSAPSLELSSLDNRYPLGKTSNRAREQAIELAGWARNRLGVGDGPVEDLERKLEENGVVWTTWELPDGVSGLTLRCQGRPFIVVEATEHEQRQRFTLAHEFAHVLVDASEHAVLTRDYSRVKKGRRTTEDIREERANHFAGVFLMPESSIRAYATGRFELNGSIAEENIMWLARQFRLSFQAAAKTLAHHGFISWKRYDEIKDNHLEMRDPTQLAVRLSEVLLKWASKLKSTPRMLRLVVEALERDLITFGRACELVMCERDALERFLAAYSRAEREL